MATPKITFPCPVRRLSVAWRDGKWTIENEIRIESMTLPKSHDLPRTTAGRGISGSWYEVVDRQGRVIYRQVMQDPFDSSMEMFDADGKIRRVRAHQHEVILDILVPDVTDLVELHIYSSARPSEHDLEMRAEGPAERIATISLGDRQGGDDGSK